MSRPLAGSGAAPGAPADPLAAFNFTLEIDGLLLGGFSQVRGLGARITTESFRQGGVNDHEYQLATGGTVENLVLRRGVSLSSALWDWYDETLRGAPRRRSGTILMLGRSRERLVSWTFRNGLPVAWSGPAFAADDDTVAVEELELVHEGWSRRREGGAR